MAEMTKEEWAAKERRIVKQSMLKAAVEWTKNWDKIVDEDVMKMADKFVAWVYDEPAKKDVVSNIEHPTPTVEQQKALKMVEELTGWTVAQVWAKFSKFPVVETAEACCNKILGG